MSGKENHFCSKETILFHLDKKSLFIWLNKLVPIINMEFYCEGSLFQFNKHESIVL